MCSLPLVWKLARSMMASHCARIDGSCVAITTLANPRTTAKNQAQSDIARTVDNRAARSVRSTRARWGRSKPTREGAH